MLRAAATTVAALAPRTRFSACSSSVVEPGRARRRGQTRRGRRARYRGGSAEPATPTSRRSRRSARREIRIRASHVADPHAPRRCASPRPTSSRRPGSCAPSPARESPALAATTRSSPSRRKHHDARARWPGPGRAGRSAPAPGRGRSRRRPPRRSPAHAAASAVELRAEACWYRRALSIGDRRPTRTARRPPPRRRRSNCAAARLLGQVQVSPRRAADQDRHAEERPPSAGGAAGSRTSAGWSATVGQPQRPRVLDQHAEHAAAARQGRRSGAAWPSSIPCVMNRSSSCALAGRARRARRSGRRSARRPSRRRAGGSSRGRGRRRSTVRPRSGLPSGVGRCCRASALAPEGIRSGRAQSGAIRGQVRGELRMRPAAAERSLPSHDRQRSSQGPDRRRGRRRARSDPRAACPRRARRRIDVVAPGQSFLYLPVTVAEAFDARRGARVRPRPRSSPTRACADTPTRSPRSTPTTRSPTRARPARCPTTT